LRDKIVRIVTWNCNGAFRNKLDQLEALQADILIIQECEDPVKIGGGYLEWAGQHVWDGANKSKGLGVFVKGDFSIARLGWPSDGLEQLLPVRINDEFDLLAVWTKQTPTRALRYVGQFWKYLQLHKEKLNATSLICGDFNSNKIWDKRGRAWNHMECIRELDVEGFVSLYHLATGEQQGEECQPTFFLHRNLSKPYHIDYVFAHRDRIPKTWSGLSIGEPANWLKLSDHMPVLVSL
jgi:exonuclease III